MKFSICYHCINRIMVKIELCFTEGQLGSQTAFWCHIQGNILQDGWGQDGEGSTGDHTTNSEKHRSGTDHIHTVLHSIHQLFAGNYHLSTYILVIVKYRYFIQYTSNYESNYSFPTSWDSNCVCLKSNSGLKVLIYGVWF